MDAYQCQRRCSQAPGPPGTVGPSARLCSGCHWNTELSCHRRCGRGPSRADWQLLPSCSSLMQGPHRVAPEWTHTHTHISIHNALWWLLPFIRKKEAVTTPPPPVGVSQCCFCTIKFRWKPLTADRFKYPSPYQKRRRRLHSSASSWCSRYTQKPFLSATRRQTNIHHNGVEVPCYKASRCVLRMLHFIYYVMSLIRVNVTSSWRWPTCMQSSKRVISLFWNK